jgi:hypothetical protein
MGHHDYRRPTLPGAVPQETYERTATPVFLVNQDGSARRREDTDDSGAQQRRAPSQDANGTGHFWRCWGDRNGPGAQFRVAVMGELDSLKKRSWLQAGGIAVLTALGLAVFGVWISAQIRAVGDAAVKPKDVAAAIEKSTQMVSAKYGDDLMKFKTQLEQAAVESYVPPETMKARK